MDFKCEIFGHNNKPIRFIGLNPQIQEASNRTLCDYCVTGQSNIINIEKFYSIVDKIPDLDKFDSLLKSLKDQIEQNSQLQNEILQPIMKVFKNFQTKLQETYNQFDLKIKLFKYRDQQFNLQKLQQLAHLVSGKEVEKIQEHFIWLQNEKHLFYEQLCKELDLIQNKINRRESYKIISNISIKRGWNQIISYPFRQPVNCLSSNYDGSQIFSGGKQWKIDEDDSTGMVHQKMANNTINSRIYGAHSRPILGVVMTNSSIITFDDKTIREGRYDEKQQVNFEVYQITNQKPSVISITDDEKQLLVGGIDGSIEIWKRQDSHNQYSRWETRHDIEKLIHNESPLTILSINKNQDQIFSGSSNNQLVIWDRAIAITRWIINQILHHQQNFISINLQDNINFVAGMENGEVDCYRRNSNRTYEKIHSFKASSEIRQMLFCDTTLLILCQDGIIVYVKMDSQSYQQTFYQRNNYQQVTISKNGKIIVAQEQDKIVYFEQSDSA